MNHRQVSPFRLSPFRMTALLSTLCLACSGEASQEGSESSGQDTPLVGAVHFDDLNVHRVHSFMITSIGTQAAWEAVRYLEFDWIVRRPDAEDFRRSHQWDKWEQRARVEWESDGEETVVLLDDLGEPSGRAWIGSEAVAPGPQLDSLVRRAYGAHINDSYWLVMPYKWTDPGVNARWLGREEGEDGVLYEVVELTFDSVGLTPQNKYHAYVNPDTWHMERWAHFSGPDAEPRFADWKGWTDVGPLVLSLDKGAIQFENLRALQGTIPEYAFAPPA